MRHGAGSANERKQRPAGARPGNGRRRRARAMARLDGNISNRRRAARHELPVPGRLRRSRLLQRRNCRDGDLLQGPVPRPGLRPAGEPRIAADHAGVRVLRRVRPQVRFGERVEDVHGPVRLPAPDGGSREIDFLPARRAKPEHRRSGSHPRNRQDAGDTPRGTDVRSGLERPGRENRVGDQPARRGIYVRDGHNKNV